MPAPQAARGGSSTSGATTTRRPGQSASRPTNGGASTTAQAASRPVNTPQPSGQVARPHTTSTYKPPPSAPPLSVNGQPVQGPRPTVGGAPVQGPMPIATPGRAPAPVVVAPNQWNTAVNSSPNHGTVYTGGTPTLAYGKKGVTSQAGLKYRKAPRPVYTGGTPTSTIGYRDFHKRPDYTMGTPTNAAGYSKRTPAPDRNSLPGDFARPMNGPDVSPPVHGAVQDPGAGRGAVAYRSPDSFAGAQYQQPSRSPFAPGAGMSVPNTEGSRPPQTRTDRAVRRSGSTRTTSPKSWTGK